MKTSLILKAYQNGHDLGDLITRIGMIVPPNTNRETYFLNNVQQYENILSRKNITVLDRNKMMTLAMRDSYKLREILSTYTDGELFSIFQFYVVYDSRKNLIDQLISGLGGSTYFILFSEPFVIHYGNYTSSIKITVSNIYQHLSHYYIHIADQLKKLATIYKLDDLIVHIDKIITKKKEEQINLWPESAKWL
jgi:hypothetical protein